MFLAADTFGTVYPEDADLISFLLFWTYIVLILVEFVLLIPQIIQRFHDFNKSGWLSIIVFIGFIPGWLLIMIEIVGLISIFGFMINAVVVFILSFIAGTAGPNKYGKEPKRKTSTSQETTQKSERGGRMANLNIKNFAPFRGRINKSTYLFRWAWITFPYWIIGGLLLLYEMMIMDIGESRFVSLFITAMLITVWIIRLSLILPQIVKRLHDMNQSGWLALLIFSWWVPYIGWLICFSFFFMLILMNGTAEKNQYGENTNSL
jgi:uncharacterized membrane protein YhaH (DUF805 family)